MKEIKVGNVTLETITLNVIHLAVYNNQFEVLKLLCEHIPTLDLAYAGRIPSN